ncbi:hypothetical protein R3P38DRAFT_1049986 [Favolaschia claudopus]|uniref:Uncharacterized protein n=1 Tax=Favolaschia claudopus TaxID=2862362 RepID=A0AAW0BFJ1_9AGAR
MEEEAWDIEYNHSSKPIRGQILQVSVSLIHNMLPPWRHLSLQHLLMSHSLASRAALIPLDNTLGAFLIGVILSSILFGVTCLQTYLYFTMHCSRDHLALKSFAVLLMLMDSVHFGFISHTLYQMVIPNFGNYTALGRPPWSLPASVVLGIAVMTMVQHFYAWRIYRFSKGIIIPVIAVRYFSLL